MANQDAQQDAQSKVLTLHRYKRQYRGHSGTWYKDFVADFLFSLRPADNSDPGETFWAEVRLRDNLLNRGKWKDLSDQDRFKALYCFAAEAIKTAGGRAVRHMELGWMPTAPYADGPDPAWNIDAINLKSATPVTIEGAGIVPVVVHQH